MDVPRLAPQVYNPVVIFIPRRPAGLELGLRYIYTRSFFLFSFSARKPGVFPPHQFFILHAVAPVFCGTGFSFDFPLAACARGPSVSEKPQTSQPPQRIAAATLQKPSIILFRNVYFLLLGTSFAPRTLVTTCCNLLGLSHHQSSSLNAFRGDLRLALQQGPQQLPPRCCLMCLTVFFLAAKKLSPKLFSTL